MGGICPIAVSEMQSYIQFFGDIDDAEEFEVVISAVDDALMKHVSETKDQKKTPDG